MDNVNNNISQQYKIFHNQTSNEVNEINKRVSLPEDLNKKKDNLNFGKIRKFPTNLTFFPKKNVLLKGKAKKQNSNIPNNIIINNNTNIINNNNINIINNNIINTNNTNNDDNAIDKEITRSMSQMNLLPIQKSEYSHANTILNNKNTRNIIFNKRRISLNNNNYTNINNNINNKHMKTYIGNNNNIYNNKNIINNNFSEKKSELNNIKNKSKDSNVILNVEEILMIEEKLSSLIYCLNNNNPCVY